jgi:glycosyltransferase involved in cell wall biosynthesis
MPFHIVLPNQLQLAELAEQAARGERPRHFASLLANELEAKVHEPGSEREQMLDALRQTVLPSATYWALARRVSAQATSGDVVFCPGELPGMQVAAVCGTGSKRPRIVVFVHNVDRPRTRFALRWWRMANKVDLFLACSQSQADFLRSFLRLSADRVRFMWDNTDTQFFTPGPVSANKRRPLIVSVGLEQRDYKTLAAATGDLDVDVSITGFSRDAAIRARTFPAMLPNNMSRRFYSWPELRQLYRDADVVVVSCYENKYAAGVQSLMEAMACGRPVIATATQGLKAYFDEVVTTRPGDAWEMRKVIQRALNDRGATEARAARGHHLAGTRFAIGRFVAEISSAMRALQ